MAFNVRKFKFRVQLRPASSKKPRRVTLVAQRRIAKKGKTVTAGVAVNLNKPESMRMLVSKPKINTQGSKAKSGSLKNASANVKVGGKWKRTAQAGG